jgi:hypothetical protein
MAVPAIASLLLHAAAISVVVATTPATGAESVGTRRDLAPIEVVEVDGSRPNEERVAVSGEAGREDRAQGRPDASPDLAPSPLPARRVEAGATPRPAKDRTPIEPRPAPATPRPPAGSTSKAARRDEPRTSRAEPYPEHSAASDTAGAASSAGAAVPHGMPSRNDGAANAANAAAGGTGGELGDGGGTLRKDAPSLIGRFGHELPRIGASVSGWQGAPVGTAVPVEVEIVLGDDGQVDRRRDPFVRAPEAEQELLAETVRRTCRSLFGALSIPGQGPRGGTVRLRVGATLAEVAPTRLTIDGSDPRAPSFTLESGRRVVFSVEVVSTGSVEPRGGPP